MNAARLPPPEASNFSERLALPRVPVRFPLGSFPSLFAAKRPLKPLKPPQEMECRQAFASGSVLSLEMPGTSSEAPIDGEIVVRPTT